MDITCKHCNSISFLPDGVIPTEGVTIECPECSKHIFVKSNSDESFSFDNIGFDKNSEESFDLDLDDSPSLGIDDSPSLGIDDSPSLGIDGSPSLGIDRDLGVDTNVRDLGIDIEVDEDLPSLNLQNLEDDSGFNKISKAEISKSMIMNKKEFKKEKVKIRKVEPEKKAFIEEDTKPKKEKSQLESYLKYKEASLIQNEKSKTPLIIGAVLLLLAVGAGAYFFLKKEEVKVATPESLGLISLFQQVDMDNPTNYKKVLQSIEKKISSNPKEMILKSAYVYIASKYFISTNVQVKSFAPMYNSYISNIKTVKKNKFIDKTLLFSDVVKLIGKKRKSFPIKQKFSTLTNKADLLFLKSYILYLENKPDSISSIINSSKISDKKKLASKAILLNSLFENSQNISSVYSEIIETNPNHIRARFTAIKYFLKFSQFEKIEGLFSELEKLMTFTTTYEKNQYVMLKTSFEEKRTNIKEAFKILSLISSSDIKEYKTLKFIIDFYYRNFYNKEALSILRDVYPRYSNKFYISKRYIEILIRDNNYTKAGEISTNLRNKNPKKAEAHYLSALLSESLGNLVEARKYTEKALELDPNHQAAIVLLARLYQKTRKNKKALKLLEKKSKELKDTHKIDLALALLYNKLKRYEDSKELLKKLLFVKDENINIIADFKLAMIDYEQNNTLDKTLNKLNQIYSRFQNLSTIRIDISKLEIEKKNYTRAISLLKEDLDIRKELDAALYLGIAYYHTNKHKEGIKLLEDVISRDMENAKAYYYLGNLYKAKEYMNKAMTSYESALKYDPKNVEYLHTIAREQTALKQYGAAFATYTDLVKISPSFDVNYELGSLYLEKGHVDKAMDYFDKASKLAKDSDSAKRVDLLIKMGDVFFKKKDYDAAQKKYKKAITINSQYAEAYYKLGELYRLKNNFKLAASNYEKARKYNPLDGKYYYQLGYLYKGMRKYKKARNIFKLYLKKIPDTPDKSEIKDEIDDLATIR